MFRSPKTQTVHTSPGQEVVNEMDQFWFRNYGYVTLKYGSVFQNILLNKEEDSHDLLSIKNAFYKYFAVQILMLS